MHPLLLTCKHEGHELVPDVLVCHLDRPGAAATLPLLLLLLVAQHEGQQAAVPRLDASTAPLLAAQAAGRQNQRMVDVDTANEDGMHKG
jgi:hypothetical protein